MTRRHHSDAPAHDRSQQALRATAQPGDCMECCWFQFTFWKASDKGRCENPESPYFEVPVPKRGAACAWVRKIRPPSWQPSCGECERTDCTGCVY